VVKATDLCPYELLLAAREASVPIQLRAPVKVLSISVACL